MPASEFTPEDAKRYYDRFGVKQDLQFYENAALECLLARADFERATSIIEFGCGTGRLAGRLLHRRMQADGRYLGVDVSSTMVRLTEERLAKWRERAKVRQTDGTMRLSDADGAFDRFVTTYVLDLLPESAIAEVLHEAHRVLVPEGKLCVVSFTEGQGAVSRAVCAAVKGLYSLSPRLVGGCRPLRLASLLPPNAWHVEHLEVVSSWGVDSEVLVARPT